MASKCQRCDKSVYQAEERIGAGAKWHRHCFTCRDCNRSLDSNTVRERKEEKEIYCASCYGKKFGPKGYGYGGGAGALSMDAGKDESGQKWAKSNIPSTGGGRFVSAGAEKCPKCGTSVYEAEKVMGAGRAWHKTCFSCSECSKKLDSTTCNDNEGKLYCKGCYGKNFGPKGFGFGGGAGALTNTGT
eukprot:gene18195-20010_t